MASNTDNPAFVVVGGGFYGCAVALELKRAGSPVVLCEQGSDLMQRASYVNQARIHQGYHYPRSLLTALRSRVNFERFAAEYAGAVYARFDHYYAIGRRCSKVSAAQFQVFCQRIGAPLARAPAKVAALFNPDLVEAVFLVREYAFDALKLKNIMLEALQSEGVDIRLDTAVDRVRPGDSELRVAYTSPGGESELNADYVLNCTYSRINQVMNASELPLVPLKHELTEMALLEVPESLQSLAFTVMDGPFFSFMPFPARGLHTLSHVRYTPHASWQERPGCPGVDPYAAARRQAPSYHVHMLKDAQRYLPALTDCRYVESLWEVKTVLPQSELDDSRPILFNRCETMPNLISVMGGKIDNIFDIREKLDILLANGRDMQ